MEAHFLLAQRIGRGNRQEQVEQRPHYGIVDGIAVSHPYLLLPESLLVAVQGESLWQQHQLPLTHLYGIRNRRDDHEIQRIHHNQENQDQQQTIDKTKHLIRIYFTQSRLSFPYQILVSPNLLAISFTMASMVTLMIVLNRPIADE